VEGPNTRRFGPSTVDGGPASQTAATNHHIGLCHRPRACRLTGRKPGHPAADLYAAAGIDLAAEPLVGLGSVCRRQATAEAHQIITALHARGITRLHGFGVKILGLARYGHLLASADSLAWSEDARRRGHPMPGCPPHRPGCPPRCRAHHANCANCLRYALHWHAAKILAAASTPHTQGAAA